MEATRSSSVGGEFPDPASLDTGDSDASPRRLVIGEGEIGNGIQCGVDASIAAEFLADMGLAINEAANSGMCDASKFSGPAGSLVQSICTVDIGGAIAYFAETVTFIQLAILNCADKLDVSALCGSSIAGISAAAAALAPYSAAVNAGCALNGQAKAATGGGRRLRDKVLSAVPKEDSFRRLDAVLGNISSTLKRMGHDPEKVPSFKEQWESMPEADVKDMLGLMEPATVEKSFRGDLPVCE